MPGTLTREEVYLRFTNNTDEVYYFRHTFTLLLRDGDCWVWIERLEAPSLTGLRQWLNIQPYEVLDHRADLLYLFGNIPDGEYTIIYNLTQFESSPDRIELVVQFEL